MILNPIKTKISRIRNHSANKMKSRITMDVNIKAQKGWIQDWMAERSKALD